jgi:uncharacterized protein (DUF1697 family)
MAKKAGKTRYLAFLRGINVGGHRVKMKALRDLFAAMTFANITTFIASGNVIFETTSSDSAKLETTIENHLKGSLGYDVDTFLRTADELAVIAALRPFESDDLDVPGHTLHVAFLRGTLDDQAAQQLLASRTEMDDFRVIGREFYWLCRGKSTDSLVKWQVVAKKVAMTSTMRNMKTIRTLAQIYPPA